MTRWISKLDAARRQLRTAIELWFNDSDPVSIHTLTCAAHQIIHDVNEARKTDADLIFNATLVKEEYRGEFLVEIRRHMNFFKHGDNDPDGIIEFAPRFSESFIAISIVGLQSLGESLGDHELAFNYWLTLHRPTWFRTLPKLLEQALPVNTLDEVRRFSKREFLENFLSARATLRSTGRVL